MRGFFVLLVVLAGAFRSLGAEPVVFTAGFARVDVTPKVPLRLSGYAGRNVPFDHVQTPLYMRAMALRAGDGPVSLLITVDSIGTPATLTDGVAARLKKTLGIAREQIVVCSSHSHTTPHLATRRYKAGGGITNLFTVPLTDEELAAAKTYTQRFGDAMVKVAREAVDDLAPATLSVGQGKVGFAMNRRIIKNGHYQGMSPNPNGAVDHSLPIVKVAGPEGELRGVVFNYACHATTFGSDSNIVDGDWPGYACRDLEENNEGLTALCTIGCGADANPEPGVGEPPAAQHAKAHGRAIAVEVSRLLKSELEPITQSPVASFGYAALPGNRPTAADLKADLKSSRPQVVRRAEYYLEVIEREGRIPETYPMPIQTWQFGDELTMVFLGGEVVVDYALRLKNELTSDLVWVSAYSNDVFAYVASEEMLSEGGYEVLGSMLYYNQPGTWKSGTEDLIILGVRELLANLEQESAPSLKEAK